LLSKLRHLDTGAWIGLGLYIVGAGAFLWGAGIDVYYWYTQAVPGHTAAAVASGGGSVIFQAIGLLFAGATGWLLFCGTWKQKLLGIPAALVLCLYLGFNMISVMSFQARERVMPVKQATDQYHAKIDAQLEAQNLQNQRQKEALDNLRDQSALATTLAARARSTDARAATKETATAAASAYIGAAFATVTAEAPPPPPDVIDPQAEFIALFLPYSIQQIQLVMTAWWGAGMVLGKVLCWFFAPALLRRRQTHVEATQAPANTETGVTPPTAAPTPPGRKFAVVASNPEREHTPAQPMTRAMAIDRVRAWRDEATMSLPGAKVGASPMHHHFARWCELKGYPVPNGKVFGDYCSALGFERDPTSQKRGTQYLGIQLMPLEKEAVAA
jgi:hypothetical protein